MEQKYKIDFAEPRPRAFLRVFRQGLQNDVWADEFVRFPQVQRILMERLQSELEYFSFIVLALSGGWVTAGKDLLPRVYSPENLVRGRQTTSKSGKRSLRPFDQYEKWSVWEQEEFSRLAERLNMPKVYFQHGYDFSFLSRNPMGGGNWFPDLRRL